MSQSPIARVQRWDEEQGEYFVEFTFDEFVVSVLDPLFMSGRSRLYWNADYPADDTLIAALEDEIRQRSRLEVEVVKVPGAGLEAVGIPLSQATRLRFLAGRPIWLWPGFLTTLGIGEKYSSWQTLRLNAALAAQASMSRTTLVNAFRRRHRELPGQQGPIKEVTERVEQLLQRALGYGCIIFDERTIYWTGRALPVRYVTDVEQRTWLQRERDKALAALRPPGAPVIDPTAFPAWKPPQRLIVSEGMRAALRQFASVRRSRKGDTM